MLKSFQTFFSILLLSASVFAQTVPSVPSPTPTPTPSDAVDDDTPIEVKSRLVVVPVSITDAMGQPVQGLKVTDFNLFEENKSQQLEQLSPAEEVPLEIALMIDISSSVDPMFEAEKQAAAKFLRDVMRPNDRATIITVGTKPYFLTGRDNAEKSAEKVAAIVPQRKSTAFYDAVLMASQHLQKIAPTGTRKVIVIISDGEDMSSELILNWQARGDRLIRGNISNLDTKKLAQIEVRAREEARTEAKQKILRAMQNADTVFYSINPAGNSYHLNVASKFGQETMKIFADQTGGNAFLLKKEADLELIFRQLTNELRAQYLLQYYPDMDFPVGKYVNIKVNVPGKTNVRVRARQGYFVKD